MSDYLTQHEIDHAYDDDGSEDAFVTASLAGLTQESPEEIATRLCEEVERVCRENIEYRRKYGYIDLTDSEPDDESESTEVDSGGETESDGEYALGATDVPREEETVRLALPPRSAFTPDPKAFPGPKDEARPEAEAEAWNELVGPDWKPKDRTIRAVPFVTLIECPACGRYCIALEVREFGRCKDCLPQTKRPFPSPCKEILLDLPEDDDDEGGICQTGKRGHSRKENRGPALGSSSPGGSPRPKDRRSKRKASALTHCVPLAPRREKPTAVRLPKRRPTWQLSQCEKLSQRDDVLEKRRPKPSLLRSTTFGSLGGDQSE